MLHAGSLSSSNSSCSTADVIPDAGRAHQVFVCDDSADRDSVSLMMVRHHRGLAKYVVAGLDLLEGSLIDFRAPNRNAVDDLHSNSFHKIWRAERELNPR